MAMAKIDVQQQLTDLTHTLIRSFYGGTVSLLQKHFHSDIIWINNMTGQYLYGYYSVSSGLLSLPRPACSQIIYRHSHLLQLNPDTWTITCEYSVFLCSDTKPSSEHFCSSFTWKEEHGEKKLIYVHMSPTLTPRLESLLLSFQGRHAQLHRIPPNEILYIEANNIHSTIHCRAGQVEANQPISQLEGLLPGYFMRIHRSFIVNKQYVRRVYRYGLELTTGIQLPVPEKRYMKVICWLET